MNRNSARAFTLIEVLISIAVIGILVSILFLGIRGVTNSAKERQTRATMSILTTLVSNMENESRRSGAVVLPTIPQWLWREGAGPIAGVVEKNHAANAPLFLDLWATPYRVDSNAIPGLDDQDDGQPMDAPMQVNESDPRAREAHRAVLNTQLVMNQIFRFPANISILENQPGSSFRALKWTLGNFDPTTTVVPANRVAYVLGNVVTHNGTSYRCTNTHEATSPPAPPTNWDVTTKISALSPIDAWGNPIIFVTRTGLGTGAALVGGEPPPGAVSLGGQSVTITNSDGRFFWASAGPDGDFSTGDDNVYSFE
jgi:prepilin-type N-terminal cleavage/methylation domain-containing protein